MASALTLAELDPVMANFSSNHKSNPVDFFLNSSTLKIFSAHNDAVSVPLAPIGYLPIILSREVLNRLTASPKNIC